MPVSESNGGPQFLQIPAMRQLSTDEEIARYEELVAKAAAHPLLETVRRARRIMLSDMMEDWERKL